MSMEPPPGVWLGGCSTSHLSGAILDARCKELSGVKSLTFRTLWFSLRTPASCSGPSFTFSSPLPYRDAGYTRAFLGITWLVLPTIPYPSGQLSTGWTQQPPYLSLPWASVSSSVKWSCTNCFTELSELYEPKYVKFLARSSCPMHIKSFALTF